MGAGEKIHTVLPDVSVVHESLVHHVCAHCFKLSKPNVWTHICKDCHYVAYCSTACMFQDSASHKNECAILGRIKSSVSPPLDEESTTCLRLLLLTMLKRHEHS